jgi:hypothetical protein
MVVEMVVVTVVEMAAEMVVVTGNNPELSVHL